MRILPEKLRGFGLKMSRRTTARRRSDLSDDFFDPTRAPDDAIRKIKSALTVVDGKVVHNTMN